MRVFRVHLNEAKSGGAGVYLSLKANSVTRRRVKYSQRVDSNYLADLSKWPFPFGSGSSASVASVRLPLT